MEFWGVEAKVGQTLDCDPGEDKYIHLSQLAIGENFEDSERVSVYVHFEGKKIMLGTFTHGTCDQIGLDLVFEKKFQISHTSKGASVFCSGYTTYIQDDDDEYPSYSGKLVPTASKTNSKEAKKEAKDAKQAVSKSGKPDKVSNGKPQVASLSSKKADRDEEDSDDDDDDDDEDDEDSEEDAAMEAASESDEDDDDGSDSDSGEEEEETPKVKDGKKRLAPNSATKTPGIDKKAKLITPEGQKQGDGKKNVHVATPHPGAKQVVKKLKETPGTSKPRTPAKETPKSNATPGSGKKQVQFTCATCQRNFNSESGLTSHNAAKHGGKREV